MHGPDDTRLNEEWRLVKDFPDYEVSNLGRLRRTTDAYWAPFGKPRIRARKGTIVKGRLVQGYPTALFPIGDPKDRKFKNKRIHILVCEAFHGPKPSPKHEVAHNDGSRDNARADNLRWATRKENQEDTVKHGRSCRGRKHRDCKLTEEQVRAIRIEFATLTHRELAAKYGVAKQTIGEITRGKNWAWLD